MSVNRLNNRTPLGAGVPEDINNFTAVYIGAQTPIRGPHSSVD